MVVSGSEAAREVRLRLVGGEKGKPEDEVPRSYVDAWLEYDDEREGR